MPADHALALRDGPGGVLIDLDVTPGAAEARFPDGFDPWRRRIGCRVQAPAREGAANAEVCRSVAAFFALPASAVRLVRGASSRQKTVLVPGIARTDALRRMEALP